MVWNTTATGKINVCNRQSPVEDCTERSQNILQLCTFNTAEMKSSQRVDGNLQTAYSITGASLTPTQNKQDLSF